MSFLLSCQHNFQEKFGKKISTPIIKDTAEIRIDTISALMGLRETIRRIPERFVNSKKGITNINISLNTVLLKAAKFFSVHKTNRNIKGT